MLDLTTAQVERIESAIAKGAAKIVAINLPADSEENENPKAVIKLAGFEDPIFVSYPELNRAFGILIDGPLRKKHLRALLRLDTTLTWSKGRFCQIGNEYPSWIQDGQDDTFEVEQSNFVDLFDYGFVFGAEEQRVDELLESADESNSKELYDIDNQSSVRIERRTESKSRLAELREKRRNAANGTTTKDSIGSEVRAEALPDKK